MKVYKVLLVDTDKKFLRITSQHLKKTKFKLLTASSSYEALKMLNILKIDLILLDITVTPSNTYYLVEKIKKSLKIPFIFITAKSLTEDRIKGYQIGCSMYLSKPFDLEELIAIINNMSVKKEHRSSDLKSLINKVRKIRLNLLESTYEVNVNTRIYFTYREKSIMQLVLNGLSNQEIAKIIKTSVRNVERYVTRLFEKTKTTNRAQLVKYICTATIL
jgi:DNA-binding NarL/FixJ family response regulator